MGAFTMPSLGADMDRGTVVEWRVAPGDRVSRGDIIAVVDTEKSTVEVEVFESGVVEELLVPVGEEVEVGTPLATIASGEAIQPLPAPSPPAASPPAASAAPPPTPSSPPSRSPAPSPPPPSASPVPVRAHVVSPLVRHLAEELGVDAEALPASGPGGVVTRADVVAAARLGLGVPPATQPSGPGAPPPPPAAPAPPSAARPVGRPRRARVPSDGARVVASPYARRRAAEAGVELCDLAGTGPGGAVLARDVPATPSVSVTGVGAATPAAAAAPSASEPASAPLRRGPEALRASVAALMARSKREIPHYYLRTTIDLGLVRSWLDRVNVDRPPGDRVVPAAVLCWATARAAATNRGLNGHWVDDGFRPASGVQLGVAVSLRGGGLLAPVIPDADTLDADELMRRLRDLTERARHGGLKASEMADPSITVTNLGDTGVEEVYGVIYPPQVAMVGFGKVVERAWVVTDRIEVRPVVTVTLAADHRATNGHEGARLLATIDRLLQDPEEPWSATEPPTSS